MTSVKIFLEASVREEPSTPNSLGLDKDKPSER